MVFPARVIIIGISGRIQNCIDFKSHIEHIFYKFKLKGHKSPVFKLTKFSGGAPGADSHMGAGQWD